MSIANSVIKLYTDTETIVDTCGKIKDDLSVNATSKRNDFTTCASNWFNIMPIFHLPEKDLYYQEAHRLDFDDHFNVPIRNLLDQNAMAQIRAELIEAGLSPESIDQNKANLKEELEDKDFVKALRAANYRIDQDKNGDYQLYDCYAHCYISNMDEYISSLWNNVPHFIETLGKIKELYVKAIAEQKKHDQDMNQEND